MKTPTLILTAFECATLAWLAMPTLHDDDGSLAYMPSRGAAA